MAKVRTGTLEHRADGWHAKFTLDVGGFMERKRVALRTHDRAQAERIKLKLSRAIESGELVLADANPDAAQDTVRDTANAHVAARLRRGVAMAPDEQRNLDKHVFPVVVQGPRGPMPFADMQMLDVRPRHVLAVLEAARDSGLAKGTVAHIKRMLVRVFNEAAVKEIVPSSPAAPVKMPEMRTETKERAILTDEEIGVFFACEAVPLELRMMGMCARVEGGMRTGDVTAWTWEDHDLDTFAVCSVPRAKGRAKGGTAQTLEVPETLRAHLRHWWEKSGYPLSGPVFPITKGKRKGQARGRRNVSFAARLRRGLRTAGVTRAELFTETARTKPVDFHSFRRAFVTALAEADVPAQRAMALSGHSDPKVHARYLGKTQRMQEIPGAAVPTINARNQTQLSPPRDDSAETAEGLVQVSDIRAGNGIRTRDPQLGKLSVLHGASPCVGDDAGADRETPENDSACFTVLHGDSSPGGTIETLDGDFVEAFAVTPETLDDIAFARLIREGLRCAGLLDEPGTRAALEAATDIGLGKSGGSR